MELQGAALNVHWLLILPVAAALLSAFVTRPWPLLSALVSWASTSACLGIALQVFQQRLAAPDSPMMFQAVPWVATAPGSSAGISFLPMGFLVDNLTAVMLSMVCFIALLIQIYSYSYISTEVHHFPTQGPTTVSRFFACLNLFLFAMLGLVLSVSTIQIYVFWELVGLCSYLLIGFWFFKTSAAVASRKAFVVTKFADLGFLLGVLCLGASSSTFLFPELLAKQASDFSPLLINLGLALLFCGAIGKSAQFPLHIWLPDAMEGPTPVSALIHAATMVAAGVYLVARCSPIYAFAPYAAEFVAWTGAITAILAATMALVQNDIKKILAYSTVSQLGFMLTALGASATTAGVFHLITHAFFKALLFLGSGAVIVACHSNDIWKMGGLNKRLPFTHFAFLMGSLALAGFPGLAGFFSKDEILAGLVHRPELLVVLAIAAFMTAFYVGRLYFVAFAGNNRAERHDLAYAGPVPAAHLSTPISPAKEVFGMQPFWDEERSQEMAWPPECQGALSEHAPEHHGPPHEVSPMMYVPLLILSIFALGLGWLGGSFGHFLQPTGEEHGHNWAVMGGSTVIALAGLGLAWTMYGKDPEQGEAQLQARLGRFLPVLQQKWYFDHIWAQALAHLVYVDSKVAGNFDEKVVDGVIYGTGRLTLQGGDLLRREQTGQVQRYALMLLLGLLTLVFGALLLEPTFLFEHPAPLQNLLQDRILP